MLADPKTIFAYLHNINLQNVLQAAKSFNIYKNFGSLIYCNYDYIKYDLWQLINCFTGFIILHTLINFLVIIKQTNNLGVSLTENLI